MKTFLSQDFGIWSNCLFSPFYFWICCGKTKFVACRGINWNVVQFSQTWSLPLHHVCDVKTQQVDVFLMICMWFAICYVVPEHGNLPSCWCCYCNLVDVSGDCHGPPSCYSDPWSWGMSVTGKTEQNPIFPLLVCKEVRLVYYLAESCTLGSSCSWLLPWKHDIGLWCPNQQDEESSRSRDKSPWIRRNSVNWIFDTIPFWSL